MIDDIIGEVQNDWKRDVASDRESNQRERVGGHSFLLTNRNSAKVCQIVTYQILNRLMPNEHTP